MDMIPCAIDEPAANAEQDWDAQFEAVRMRLRQTVVEGVGEPSEAHTYDATARLRACVRDGLAALDQLHAMLLLQRAGQAPRGSSIGSAQGGRHPAVVDRLAAQPNRDAFCALLDRALARASAEPSVLAVLCIDLDGFKAIGHLHGSEVGDELLRSVAADRSAQARGDDLVSRLEGDEFACLLRGLPAGRVQLSRLACKLFDAVSAPFRIGSLDLTVRPNIGVAIWPLHGATASALLGSADAALGYAKQRQTGYAFFDRRNDAPTGQVAVAGASALA
jgi:diguanylate cyclase